MCLLDCGFILTAEQVWMWLQRCFVLLKRKCQCSWHLIWEQNSRNAPWRKVFAWRFVSESWALSSSGKMWGDTANALMSRHFWKHPSVEVRCYRTVQVSRAVKSFMLQLLGISVGSTVRWTTEAKISFLFSCWHWPLKELWRSMGVPETVWCGRRLVCSISNVITPHKQMCTWLSLKKGQDASSCSDPGKITNKRWPVPVAETWKGRSCLSWTWRCFATPEICRTRWAGLNCDLVQPVLSKC